MKLAAGTDSDACEEDRSVEDSEVEAEEVQEEEEEATVGEKSNWGLPQRAGSSTDSHRFSGHEKGLRKTRLKPSKASNVTDNTTFCILTLLYKKGTPFVLVSPTHSTCQVLSTVQPNP
jgi:hypothetical protein